MASSFSQYKLELMTTGENAGTWGTITNANLGSASAGTYQGIEQAIGGKASITYSTTSYTLSFSDSNAAQEGRSLYLDLGGTPGGAANLIVPTIQKSYIIKNGTGETVTAKTAAGTGVAIPTGFTALVYADGTNVVTGVDYLTSLTTTDITLNAQGDIRFGDSDSSNYVAFQGPATVASNVTWTLPSVDGSVGQALTTNGSGVLSFSDAGISTGKAIAMAIVFG